MSKRVIDLNAQELELLASEAWRAAGREALAKGFAVTGSEDGRRYRYHPDGRREDLGPVMRASSTTSIEPTDPKSWTSKSAYHDISALFEMPAFEIPKFNMPEFEMPAGIHESAGRGIASDDPVRAFELAAFRKSAERGLADAYNKMVAAAGEETGVVLESTHSTDPENASDYRLHVIEAARVSTNAAFDFAGNVITAKTLGEIVKLTSAHARRQLEALIEQREEFKSLAQPSASETSAASQLMTALWLSSAVGTLTARARHDFEVLGIELRQLGAVARQIASDDLMTVQSLSEVVELSMSDMRERFEALEAQNKVFVSFMQKVVTEKSEAIAPEKKSHRQPTP